jgi:phosphatidylglycerophosphatase A
MEIRTIKKAVILFIAEGAYSGRVSGAPGTVGTVVGVFLYLLIKDLPTLWYLIVFVLVAGIGTWVAGEAEKQLGRKDAPSIVIDEIAGYFVSMFMIPFGWGMVIAGFVLFRIFDILKPWPIKKLQDVHGGAGVMLDDIGAGIYTNVILQVVVWIKIY